MPAWEYDLLLESVQREVATDNDSATEPRLGPAPDPWAQVPAGLEAL